jgi:hypothetical protein
LPAGPPGDVPGADGGQQRLGLRGGEEPWCTGRNQFQQQPVQPVDGAGAGAGEFIAAVGQQPQRDQFTVDGDLGQTRSADGDDGDGVRVSGVGLTAVAGGEHPSAGRQLGRHVDHGLAVSDQPLRDVPADAVGSFDRPDPIRPPPGGGQHLPVAIPIGAEPATAQHPLPLVQHFDGRRQLVRIDSDDNTAHAVLLA